MSRIDHTYCVHSMAKKAKTEKEANMAPKKNVQMMENTPEKTGSRGSYTEHHGASANLDLIIIGFYSVGCHIMEHLRT